MPDIVAMKFAVPVNALNIRVCSVLRGCDRITESDNTQYAATAGDDVVAIEPGASMEYLAVDNIAKAGDYETLVV